MDQFTDCQNLSDFYKAYGEDLASRLPDIDTYKNGYVYLESIGNPTEIQEAAQRGGFSDGQPFLILEDYQEDLETAGRDNYYSKITGSLVVLIQSGPEKEKKRQAYQQGRTLVLQAIAQMISDSQEGPLEERGISIDLREFPCEKIGPINGSCFGFGVQFTWHVPLDLTAA